MLDSLWLLVTFVLRLLDAWAIRRARRRVREATAAHAAAPSWEAQQLVKHARAELAAVLRGRAVPCSVCGAEPHAIVQPVALVSRSMHGVRSKVRTAVEIGCLSCRGRRVRGWTRREARKQWDRAQCEA